MMIPLTVKYTASLLATGLTFYAFIPYIRDIVGGRIRPHVYSWVVWGLTTAIVFLAQVDQGGGTGAWPIGVSAALTLTIATLAARHHGDISIHVSDKVFLAMALSSLPLWFLTADPTLSVLVLTLVDLLGFGPTLRKAWVRPDQEQPLFFLLFFFRNLLVIVALEDYNSSTVLFPAAVALACVLLAAIILIRRKFMTLP